MHTVCDYLLLDYGLSKCVVSHTYILEHINTSKHRVTTSSVATVYACIYSTYIHTCVHAYTSCDYLLVATVYLCMYITHACIHACAHKSCDCLLVGYGLSTYMYHIHIYITYIHTSYIHTYIHMQNNSVVYYERSPTLCRSLWQKGPSDSGSLLVIATPYTYVII